MKLLCWCESKTSRHAETGGTQHRHLSAPPSLSRLSTFFRFPGRRQRSTRFHQLDFTADVYGGRNQALGCTRHPAKRHGPRPGESSSVTNEIIDASGAGTAPVAFSKRKARVIYM